MKKENTPKSSTLPKADPTIDQPKSSTPEPIKKPRKIFLKLLILSVLLALSVSAYFARQVPSQQDKPTISYSTDQQHIINEFGLPDTFQVIQNLENEEANTRSEIWRYLKLGEVFLFENGQFSARKHQNFNISTNSQLTTVKIEPAAVYNLSTLEEVNQFVGGEPNYSAEINPEILTSAKLYNYDNLVIVGTIDNQISWFRTLAAVSASPDNNPASDDEEWKVGRVFSQDNQFSVFVDVDIAQNLVALKELQNEAHTHHFCYSADDVEQDFFCDGLGRPLFSIIEYTEADYQEFLQTPLADTEILLARRGGKVYTFTHPNGDVPAIIMGRANEFYDMVIESFAFTDQM